jgi:hypothetical protein
VPYIEMTLQEARVAAADREHRVACVPTDVPMAIRRAALLPSARVRGRHRASRVPFASPMLALASQRRVQPPATKQQRTLGVERRSIRAASRP